MKRVLASVLILWFFLHSSLHAVDVGDVVTFDYQGKQMTGTVTKVLLDGKAVFVDVGPERDLPIPVAVNQLRIADSPASPAVALTGEASETILELPDLAPVVPGRVVDVANLQTPGAMQVQTVNRELYRVTTDPIAVPKPAFSLERDRPVLLGLNPMVVASSVRSSWSKPNKETTIHVVSDDEPKAVKTIKINGHRVWLASADVVSGRVLAIVNDPGSDRHLGVVVIDGLRDGRPQCIFSANLTQQRQERKPFHVTSRHMINDHLMALTYDNQVAVFDIDKKCQLWRAAANTDRIQVSPDGSVLAFSAAGQVAFVRTETGQPIGGLPRPIMFGGSMAFSPDGTMFAIAHLENLWVYRIAGGKLLRTITASGALTLNTQPLIWPTTRYLVTPNGQLIDLSAGFVVWKYNGDLQVTEFSDHLSTGLVAMADDDVVSFQRLPHREALNKSQGDLSGQIVLQPPNPIQLDLDVDASLRPNRPRLIENLTSAITQAGYTVDSNADTILTVNVRRSRTETLNYIVIGPDSPGGNSVTVNYIGIGVNAELNQGGERIWKSSTGTGMGTPSFKPRREPYEVTKELNDKFLMNFSLPKRVISPKFQNGFGSTWVRADGLQ